MRLPRLWPPRLWPPRLWPDGIAARIALTLILGLVVTQAISALVFLIERPALRPPAPAMDLVRQIAAAVDAVDAAPLEERAALAHLLENPFFHVTWLSEAPRGMTEPAGQPFERFRGMLSLHLDDRVRSVRIDADRPGFLHFFGFEGGHPGRTGRPIRIALELEDGWLVLDRRPPEDEVARLIRFGLWMGLIAAAVVGLSLWAARRITAPLARFADAAERLGLDGAAPPLPEQGPTEIRAATRAVNRMQTRLGRFVEDRTRMLAAISHDLRTPITRLRLRAEFVEDPEQQRKMLADLNDMETMISATLAFARDDAEREPRIATDLADLLQSLCEDFADAGQAASYAGPPHFPYLGRPVALKRAFGNLIDNAVKYGGTARVTLAVTPEQAVVTVEDEGPGLPAAELEKVFAPFYRVETSRSRDTGGTGLGLAVARSVIRGHGGDVTLANRAGGGLIATVVLPG